MKQLKLFGLATATAVVLMALAVGSASATTLEVGGVAENKTITISGSLQSESSATLTDTGGSLVSTCTGGSGTGATKSPFTASAVSGSILSQSGGSCTRSVTVHNFGTVTVEHIAGSTNGTVVSSGGEATMASVFGTLTCKTSSTDIGILTGKSSGQAVLDVNAVVNCGFLLPSAVTKGTSVVTSPGGLGVSS